MSEYYKANREADWNYGGKNWKLSRSRIDLFLECPRCFYIDNKFGVKRVPGFPFTLNSAVDFLLKQEFDISRVKGQKHPLQAKYGIEAIPYKTELMDEWRDSLRGGLKYLHDKTNFLITGGIDDVWVNPQGELIVVDYKATSNKEDVTELNKPYQEGYKKQMEVYQWLLRQNGYKVSSTGYFVYCNGKTDREAFDGKLDFDVTLIVYVGDDSWIEKTLIDIKKCLDSDIIPESGKSCDHCAYFNAREKFEK